MSLTNTFDGIPLSTFKPVSESVVKNLILKSAAKSCQLDPIPTPLLVEGLLKKTSLDQNELKNYHPVSSLSLVSEIIEKLVLSQLSDYLSANNLYNRFQSAY